MSSQVLVFVVDLIPIPANADLQEKIKELEAEIDKLDGELVVCEMDKNE